MKKILEINEQIFFGESLRNLIPHRGPALMIDGVRFDSLFSDKIVGYKKILATDPWLDGHFPPPLKPFYPGHCLTECCNLTALALIMLRFSEVQGTPMIARIGKTKYKLPAVIGDDITFELTLTDIQRNNSVFFFNALIRNQRGSIITLIYDMRGVNNIRA